MPDPSITNTVAFEHGYRARQDGCQRILCNPSSGDAEREWLRGWDAADRLLSILQRALHQDGWCFDRGPRQLATFGH